MKPPGKKPGEKNANRSGGMFFDDDEELDFEDEGKSLSADPHALLDDERRLEKPPSKEDAKIPEEFRDPQAAYRKYMELQKEKENYQEEIRKANEDNQIMRDHFMKISSPERSQDSRAQSQDPKEKLENIRREYWRDPVVANEEIFNMKMAPFVDMYLQDREQAVLDSMKAQPEWESVKEPFMRAWSETPVQMRNKRIAMSIYHFARLDKYDKERAAEKGKEGDEAERKPNVVYPRENAPIYERPQAEVDGKIHSLDPEEDRVRKAFGLDEKTWAERAKAARGRVI